MKKAKVLFVDDERDKIFTLMVAEKDKHFDGELIDPFIEIIRQNRKLQA